LSTTPPRIHIRANNRADKKKNPSLDLREGKEQWLSGGDERAFPFRKRKSLKTMKGSRFFKESVLKIRMCETDHCRRTLSDRSPLERCGAEFRHDILHGVAA
jgi:hypothetical protein